MRTIFRLLCILSVTVSEKAQFFATGHWVAGECCDTANHTYKWYSILFLNR